jgi:hypothetical protein
VKGALAMAQCLVCALLALSTPARAVPVDVELVIAVDVSESMDREEFAVQRAGYVEALRDPAFIRAARSGFHGRIAVTYFEWAGSVLTGSVVPWQIIDSAESAYAFAARLESRPFNTFRDTSISSALVFGASSLEASAFEGERRVIDISGDGPNNFGPPVTEARDAAVARGVTINGLPILIRPSPIFPDISRYYERCVIGGPEAFVLPIHTVSEFATAIRRKLILEVSGSPGGAAIVQAAADAPVDCMIGERVRRSLMGRYYPELDR